MPVALGRVFEMNQSLICITPGSALEARLAALAIGPRTAISPSKIDFITGRVRARRLRHGIR
jgi:hypothetical protein